ncbi:MAG: GNAT family N-acetyltransferase [Tatlockia sp.]|nr:GNAT family N-acetyltransferase [Tatlockia sp.]
MLNLVQRVAITNDLEHLNQLICDSRQYNGYDKNNNTYFIKKFGLTTDYINNQFVFAYEAENRIIAVSGLSFIDKLKLDYFFISPDFIGTGLGRKMWNDICNFIKAKGWGHFEFVSNPFSVSFYRHMGAEIIADYEEAENESKIMQYKL